MFSCNIEGMPIESNSGKTGITPSTPSLINNSTEKLTENKYSNAAGEHVSDDKEETSSFATGSSNRGKDQVLVKRYCVGTKR